MATAIVTGSTGMDGSHMVDLLNMKKYNVITVERDRIENIFSFIKQNKPDEIYNFAGVSDVINPFENVAELMDINVGLPINILDAIVKYSPKTKYFQASSCLSLTPYYPYGISKRAADELIKQYRVRYNIFACSGIFYPHDSERRRDSFFLKKVVNAAVRKEKITLSNLDRWREFGYAPEYCEAAWLMLQQDNPFDYEIGTGQLYNLEYVVNKVFSACGLNWKDYITELKSPDTLQYMSANINMIPGWNKIKNIDEIIKTMINAVR